MLWSVLSGLLLVATLVSAVEKECVANEEDLNLNCATVASCLGFARQCLMKGNKTVDQIMRCIMKANEDGLIKDEKCSDCVTRRHCAVCGETPIDECANIDAEANKADPCFGQGQAKCPKDKCHWANNKCNKGAETGGGKGGRGGGKGKEGEVAEHCETEGGEKVRVGGFVTEPCDEGVGQQSRRCKKDGKFSEANVTKCKAGCKSEEYGGLMAKEGFSAAVDCADLEEGDFVGGEATLPCGEGGKFGDLDTSACYKGCENPEPWEGFTKVGEFAEYPCNEIPKEWGLPKYMDGMARTMCMENGEWEDKNDVSKCVEDDGCGDEPKEFINCATVRGCLIVAQKCILGKGINAGAVASLMKCVIQERVDNKITDAACNECLEKRIVEACDGWEKVNDACITKAAEQTSPCHSMPSEVSCNNTAGCSYYKDKCVMDKCLPPCAQYNTPNPKKFKRNAKECNSDKKNLCSWGPDNKCENLCYGTKPTDFAAGCEAVEAKKDCKGPACKWSKGKCGLNKKLKKTKCKKLKEDDCCTYNGCTLVNAKKGKKVCVGKFKL